jgi:hypothetical protein
MTKVLGLALAFTLALSFAAIAAEETKGTVLSVDQADQSIILDDGTRLSVSDGQMSEVRIGQQVQAAYELKGDRKVVTELRRVSEQEAD